MISAPICQRDSDTSRDTNRRSDASRDAMAAANVFYSSALLCREARTQWFVDTTDKAFQDALLDTCRVWTVIFGITSSLRIHDDIMSAKRWMLIVLEKLLSVSSPPTTTRPTPRSTHVIMLMLKDTPKLLRRFMCMFENDRNVLENMFAFFPWLVHVKRQTTPTFNYQKYDDDMLWVLERMKRPVTHKTVRRSWPTIAVKNLDKSFPTICGSYIASKRWDIVERLMSVYRPVYWMACQAFNDLIESLFIMPRETCQRIVGTLVDDCLVTPTVDRKALIDYVVALSTDTTTRETLLRLFIGMTMNFVKNNTRLSHLEFALIFKAIIAHYARSSDDTSKQKEVARELEFIAKHLKHATGIVYLDGHVKWDMHFRDIMHTWIACENYSPVKTLLRMTCLPGTNLERSQLVVCFHAINKIIQDRSVASCSVFLHDVVIQINDVMSDGTNFERFILSACDLLTVHGYSKESMCLYHLIECSLKLLSNSGGFTDLPPKQYLATIVSKVWHQGGPPGRTALEKIIDNLHDRNEFDHFVDVVFNVSMHESNYNGDYSMFDEFKTHKMYNPDIAFQDHVRVFVQKSILCSKIDRVTSVWKNLLKKDRQKMSTCIIRTIVSNKLFHLVDWMLLLKVPERIFVDELRACIDKYNQCEKQKMLCKYVKITTTNNLKFLGLRSAAVAATDTDAAADGSAVATTSPLTNVTDLFIRALKSEDLPAMRNLYETHLIDMQQVSATLHEHPLLYVINKQHKGILRWLLSYVYQCCDITDEILAYAATHAPNMLATIIDTATPTTPCQFFDVIFNTLFGGCCKNGYTKFILILPSLKIGHFIGTDFWKTTRNMLTNSSSVIASSELLQCATYNEEECIRLLLTNEYRHVWKCVKKSMDEKLQHVVIVVANDNSDGSDNGSDNGSDSDSDSDNDKQVATVATTTTNRKHFNRVRHCVDVDGRGDDDNLKSVVFTDRYTRDIARMEKNGMKVLMEKVTDVEWLLNNLMDCKSVKVFEYLVTKKNIRYMEASVSKDYRVFYQDVGEVRYMHAIFDRKHLPRYIAKIKKSHMAK